MERWNTVGYRRRATCTCWAPLQSLRAWWSWSTISGRSHCIARSSYVTQSPRSWLTASAQWVTVHWYVLHWHIKTRGNVKNPCKGDTVDQKNEEIIQIVSSYVFYKHLRNKSELIQTSTGPTVKLRNSSRLCHLKSFWKSRLSKT